jgi:hypothetical protein
MSRRRERIPRRRRQWWVLVPRVVAPPALPVAVAPWTAEPTVGLMAYRATLAELGWTYWVPQQDKAAA